MIHPSRLWCFTVFKNLYYNRLLILLTFTVFIWVNRQLHMQTLLLIRSPNYADFGFLQIQWLHIHALLYPLVFFITVPHIFLP